MIQAVLRKKRRTIVRILIAIKPDVIGAWSILWNKMSENVDEGPARVNLIW